MLHPKRNTNEAPPQAGVQPLGCRAHRGSDVGVQPLGCRAHRGSDFLTPSDDSRKSAKALTPALLAIAILFACTNVAVAQSGATLGAPIIAKQAELPAAKLHLPQSRSLAVTPASAKTETDKPEANQPEADKPEDNEPPGYITAALKSGHYEYGSTYPPPANAWSFDFAATPLPGESLIYNDAESRRPYDGKSAIPVQRPIIELGRPLYLNGMLPPAGTFLGETNLMQQHFYVYGDYRMGYGSGTNANGEFRNIARQFNLDFDWGITSTERVHAFMRPFDRNGNFSGINLVNNDFDFQENLNVDFVTAFFEGDAGAITGGATGTHYPFDLPFTFGLIPLVFQNGIWMEDAVAGAAFALPSKNNKFMKWSNFDASFFAALDQIDSDAFAGDRHAAQMFGTAWFIEAYEGYIESGYAFVRDRNNSDRSYHNMTVSFARRYFWKVSNAVRVIANVGQELPRDQRTADGVLLLVENAWNSIDPIRVVPYTNFFAGFGRPQSLARAGLAGGILRNTGINFESDNLNGYPTLDPTARNTYGGAVGLNVLGAALDHQIVLEAAFVGVMDDIQDTNAGGNQAGVGLRYQLPLSHRTLIRMDTMYGWRENNDNLTGGRFEYRWKF